MAIYIHLHDELDDLVYTVQVRQRLLLPGMQTPFPSKKKKSPKSIKWLVRWNIQAYNYDLHITHSKTLSSSKGHKNNTTGEYWTQSYLQM
jgi:hypothetical protein